MKKQYKDYIIAIFLILIVVYLTYDNIERFFIEVKVFVVECVNKK